MHIFLIIGCSVKASGAECNAGKFRRMMKKIILDLRRKTAGATIES